jgi:hypothetical protein
VFLAAHTSSPLRQVSNACRDTLSYFDDKMLRHSSEHLVLDSELEMIGMN